MYYISLIERNNYLKLLPLDQQSRIILIYNVINIIRSMRIKGYISMKISIENEIYQEYVCQVINESGN